MVEIAVVNLNTSEVIRVLYLVRNIRLSQRRDTDVANNCGKWKCRQHAIETSLTSVVVQCHIIVVVEQFRGVAATAFADIRQCTGIVGGETSQCLEVFTIESKKLALCGWRCIRCDINGNRCSAARALAVSDRKCYDKIHRARRH